MSDQNPPTTPAGWYPDGQGDERYWDGQGWTEQTRPLGGDAAPAAPQAPQGDRPTPGLGGPSASSPHEEATRIAGTPPSGGDRPQGSSAPAAPSSEPTRVAGSPLGGAAPPAGGGWAPPPGAPGAPGAPGQPYGAAPGTPPYGQQPGQPGPYGAPGQYPPPGQPGGPPWQQQSAGGGGGKGKLIGIIGGAVLALVIVVVLLVVFLGGGSGPGDVAKRYFDGVVDGDCGVVEVFTDDTLETLTPDAEGGDRGDKVDAAEQACEDDDEEFGDVEGCEYDEKSVEEDGDEATVTFDVTGCDDDSNNEDGVELSLVQEDGDWRVDLAAPESAG